MGGSRNIFYLVTWLPYKVGKAPKLRTPPHPQIVRLSLRMRKASNSWLGKMRCFPSLDNAVFRDLDERMNKGRGTNPFFSAVLLEVMRIWRGQFRYPGYILIMIRSQLLKRGLWGAKNTVSLQLWVTSPSRLSECLPVSFLLVSLCKLGPPPRVVCLLVSPVLTLSHSRQVQGFVWSLARVREEVRWYSLHEKKKGLRYRLLRQQDKIFEIRTVLEILSQTRAPA